MLVKGSDVIGLEVITIQKGREVNNVQDIIYSSKEQKVKALLVDQGGWFSDAEVIPIMNVLSIGQDAVMVQSGDMIKKASEIHDGVAAIIKGEQFLTGTKIMTEDGTELGTVNDLYFDSVTGKVTELEVSQGIEDFRSGKKRVKVSDIITIGEDATIVKSYTEEVFAQQAEEQGIQGALQKAKQQTQQTAEKAQKEFSRYQGEAEKSARNIQQDSRTKQYAEQVKGVKTKKRIEQEAPIFLDHAKETLQDAGDQVKALMKDVKTNEYTKNTKNILTAKVKQRKLKTKQAIDKADKEASRQRL